MTLNDIKLKRLTEAAEKREKKKRPKKKLHRLSSGSQAYVDPDAVNEGKDYKDPKFVRDCVSAITQDPVKLAKVQERPGGSPFPICKKTYSRNKAALAAKHSQGRHHSNKDYEESLKKLREAVEARAAQNIDPRSVCFGPRLEEDKILDPRTIRFAPGE